MTKVKDLVLKKAIEEKKKREALDKKEGVS